MPGIFATCLARDVLCEPQIILCQKTHGGHGLWPGDGVELQGEHAGEAITVRRTHGCGDKP